MTALTYGIAYVKSNKLMALTCVTFVRKNDIINENNTKTHDPRPYFRLMAEIGRIW